MEKYKYNQTCVLTNMCMITDGTKILVEDRIDPNWKGICFPGGHLEIGESLVDSVIREVKEETGLDIDNVKICGIKQFYIKEREATYIVFLYKTDTFKGDIISSDEGRIFWIERKDLEKYELVPGFLKMLEIFEDDNLSENYHYKENGVWKDINK